jgi:DNA polymerase-3 subunit epsilon
VTMLDYTAIDFETANSYRGSPCAVGLVRVRGGKIVDERRWLMRPPEGADWFDSFNVWVHNITAEMVADAPRWKDILPVIIEFIGDDVVVAHNAGFDIGVIRYACAVDNIEWPEMRFLCSLVLARRALALPSYRLPFVTEALGHDMGDHHDPLDDARAVTEVVSRLAAQEDAATLDDLASSLKVYVGRMERGIYKGSVAVSGSSALERPDVNPDADPDGYLYGRVIVFTGKLWAMVRQGAWKECARVGAIAEKDTTRRTNVLVIGDLNPAYLRPGENLSARARKAFALQDSGQDIEVMTEDDFLRCLEAKPLADLTDLLGATD